MVILLLLSQEAILKAQDSLFSYAGPPSRSVAIHFTNNQLKELSFVKRKILKLTGRSENKKVVAIGLTLALGPFGAHRLYLGTDEKVPIVYTLTLGGGLGILPAIDLFHIVFSKDLEQFEDNPNVFMWQKKR